MPSFIHTGDLHLGRPFRKLGTPGGEIRKAQLQTLKNILDTVKRTRSDFLVVAGDLFDANSVSGRLVQDVLNCFASIAPVPVYIQPGTHDVFDSDSIYRTILHSAMLPSNVTVIPEEPTEFNPVPDVGLFAAANTTKRGGDRPLKRLSALASRSEAKYKVAVVHGSVNVPGLSIDSDEPIINLKEIASSPFDYVAMGHWHKRQEWSQGSTKAFYCGTPETLEFDETPSPGTVTLVSLSDDVKTVAKKVGTYKWMKVSLDLSLVPDMKAILDRANQAAGSHTLLRLELKGNLAGQDGFANYLGVDDLKQNLQQELEPNFFFVEVSTDGLTFHEPVPGDFPPNSIGRAFHEIMAEKIEKAQDPEEKEILHQALLRGALYLSGKAGIRP